MAAIGKIRSWGPVLVTVIGLALFAFIAEEAFRSCESTRNQSRQRVGEVLGTKMDVQEYQRLVDEYTDVLKTTQGRENFSEQELNRLKDQVWNQFVQNTVIENEAKKLGLTVTDAEMQNLLAEGTNPMLTQTPFVNQQTGRFDASALQKFLAEYKNAQTQNPQMAEQYRPMYNYWTFLERHIRQQLLAQKYQTLLGGCLLSNPVSAKLAFDADNQESSVLLASFPYSAVNDNKVEVTDADIQAKYNEMKPRFKQNDETRGIKYVDFQVVASKEDRAALQKAMNDFREQLVAAEDPSDLVRKSASLVSYLGIPQTSDAFPSDIAQRLDSIAVGATSAVIANERDNTLNIIKLVAKQQLPDSIQFRAIQVTAADEAAINTKADSIVKALEGGADFEAIAKKYGQTGEKTWLTSAQYQNASSLDIDTRNYLNTLNTASLNAINNLKLAQLRLVVQVLDRKAMKQKYTAAVIKKTIDFSKDTYNAAYNKFSQFVSENQTLESMEKAASKYGYQIQEIPTMRNDAHLVADISGTREALKWVFESKKGDVSPLYECGNNDHLLVLALTDITPKGFVSLDNEQLKEYVKGEAMKDKKAEQILTQIKGIKSIDEAKTKGAKVDSVKQITMGAAVFVQATGSSEPALSGAVSSLAKGQFCKQPVKGNGGVYLFQVLDKTNREGVKFDAKAEEKKLQQKAMQYAGNFMQELYQNANIKDNRYLFF